MILGVLRFSAQMPDPPAAIGSAMVTLVSMSVAILCSKVPGELGIMPNLLGVERKATAAPASSMVILAVSKMALFQEYPILGAHSQLLPDGQPTLVESYATRDRGVAENG